MEQQSNDFRTTNIWRRPQTEELVDVHVYVVPSEKWIEQRKLAKGDIIDHAISSGFVRVLPSITLLELRNDIRDQLGAENVPETFVFLRSVGRNFTQAKSKQELELKVKSFLPPYADEPELYLKEGEYTAIRSASLGGISQVRSTNKSADSPVACSTSSSFQTESRGDSLFSAEPERRALSLDRGERTPMLSSTQNKPLKKPTAFSIRPPTPRVKERSYGKVLKHKHAVINSKKKTDSIKESPSEQTEERVVTTESLSPQTDSLPATNSPPPRAQNETTISDEIQIQVPAPSTQDLGKTNNKTEKFLVKKSSEKKVIENQSEKSSIDRKSDPVMQETLMISSEEKRNRHTAEKSDETKAERQTVMLIGNKNNQKNKQYNNEIKSRQSSNDCSEEKMVKSTAERYSGTDTNNNLTRQISTSTQENKLLQPNNDYPEESVTISSEHHSGTETDKNNLNKQTPTHIDETKSRLSNNDYCEEKSSKRRSGRYSAITMDDKNRQNKQISRYSSGIKPQLYPLMFDKMNSKMGDDDVIMDPIKMLNREGESLKCNEENGRDHYDEGFHSGELVASEEDNNSIETLDSLVGNKDERSKIIRAATPMPRASSIYRSKLKSEIKKLQAKAEDTKAERRLRELKRDALMQKIKDLQKRKASSKDRAREEWRKRFQDVKKSTPRLEDHCAKLRQELEKLVKDMLVSIKTDPNSKPHKPSKKTSYKIMIMRHLQEVEDLRRRLQSVAIKLSAETKLRSQAEVEVKRLRQDLLQKKTQVTLTRKQTAFPQTSEQFFISAV